MTRLSEEMMRVIAVGDCHVAPGTAGDLATEILDLRAALARERAEVARLREGEECHVARPGEGTYECRVESLCPACRLRDAEVGLARERERAAGLVELAEEARAFLGRTAAGGSIVSSAAMTAQQIAIARAADRMLVTPDGYGFVYVPGPRFCACGRIVHCPCSLPVAPGELRDGLCPDCYDLAAGGEEE